MTFLKSRLWASLLFFLCGQPPIWAEQPPPLVGTAYVISWFSGGVALWKYE